VRLHQQASAGLRTRAVRRRGTGGAEAEDAVSVETNLYSSYVVTKTPWRDGTTHLVMSPLEFMQRLAALVPRPRPQLIRFGVRMTSLREVSGPPLREHGVLAPNAKLRAQVDPAEPPHDADARLDPESLESEPDDGHRWGSRISWALLLERVLATT
jgi:hypothetical protein